MIDFHLFELHIKLSLTSNFYFRLCNIAFVGAQRGEDRFSHHPKLWMFSYNGVQVYTPDGSQEVSSIAPEQACHDIGTPEEPKLRCYWADAISDGHKYVWATVWGGRDVGTLLLYPIFSITVTCSWAVQSNPYPCSQSMYFTWTPAN